MNIIIDSNVLFSALIKDSATRKIIFEYEGLFLFPSFIFDELEKHKSELSDKTGLPNDEFDRLLGLILDKVKVIPDKELYPYKKEAFDIIKDIDPDDAVFVACVLAYPDSVLWSDDKKLKKARGIKVLNTQEIID